MEMMDLMCNAECEDFVRKIKDSILEEVENRLCYHALQVKIDRPCSNRRAVLLIDILDELQEMRKL